MLVKEQQAPKKVPQQFVPRRIEVDVDKVVILNPQKGHPLVIVKKYL